MAQFDTVLDGVRLALTWAPPAEIQAFLEGLVEEQIISEAYSKSLSLLRLRARRKSSREAGSEQGCTTQKHRSQLGQVMTHGTSKESAVSDRNQTGSPVGAYASRTPQIHPLFDHHVSYENTPELTRGQSYQMSPKEATMDQRYLKNGLVCAPIRDYQGSLGVDGEMTELLRSAASVQRPVSDNERNDEGNLKSEREWLEQVEEAARRIAVPLWQHWDRGQKMLVPLVPDMISDSPVAHSEARHNAFEMEEETDFEVVWRTLDFYAHNFQGTEVTDTNFPLDSLQGLSLYDDEATSGFNDLDCFSVSASSVIKDHATADSNNNITEGLMGDHDVFSATNTTENLLSLAAETQRYTETADCFAHFPSSFAPKDTYINQKEILPDPNAHQSMAVDVTGGTERVPRTAYTTCDVADCHEKQDYEETVDSSWGNKMQEVDQDPYICPYLGDLPDDLDDLLFNEDILAKLVDNVLFGDPWLNCEDDIDNFGEVSDLTELLSSDIQQQGQNDKPTDKTTNRRKRSRVPPSKQSTDENTPTRAKRQKAAGQVKTKEVQTEPAVAQGSDAGPDASLVETKVLSTPPPNILHFPTPVRSIPQVQFITIPDSSRYQVVRTLQFSPPVIRLPLSNTAATPHFIFVPAPSPPSNCQVPPLSPVDGAVAPVQMSSSPPGSLSDSASKAMSPPCVSPQSPSNEKSPFKESPVPQSPTYFDIPQTVKDYIQEAKAHMSQTCEEMETGLSLTSHYVDVQVIKREILRSGKNTNKCLEKELIIMGDTDRQKSMVGMNQIFESSDGNKPKSYMLLLGNAGMGKTTRIRRLCLDWSRDRIPQFDFVFLLDGKALTLAKPIHSLQTLLLSLSSFAPSCMDPEAVFAQILAAPTRVLVIFDGFEELREYEILLQSQEKDLITSLQKDSKAQSYTVRQLYSAILQRVLLPGCTLLLSTRPRGNVTPLLRRADSLLEVCGFSPSDVETYLSNYFTDQELRVSAMNRLKTSSYLNLLCWNPSLCRLVCLVLEQSQNSEILPRTLTGLCHRVLRLKMEAECRSKDSQAEPETQRPKQTEEETQTQISSVTQMRRCQSRPPVRTHSRMRSHTRSRTQRTRGARGQDKEEDDEEGEEMQSCRAEVGRTEERELLSQLSSLAWEGVKANSSVVSRAQTVSTKLKAFGLRTGLLRSNPMRTKQAEACSEKGHNQRDQRRMDTENTHPGDEHILLWASPFLRSYLAGVHLSLSRTVSDRTFLQTLPFQTGSKGRRRPQREELELTQRFAVGLLFHKRTELQWLHLNTNAAFRDMLVSKQSLVTKHLEGLSLGELSPAQVLEACHYVYEGCFTHSESSRDSRLAAHLAVNLPELLTFHGVPLSPPDVFAVQNVLQQGGSKGRSFCLDLQESGIQISGLKALVALGNINTYRACIADVIGLWEQLEQSGEEGLLHGAVAKFKSHPLKATQVCHIEHLAKLVDIHTRRRLSDSTGQSDSVLADGVPAVKELHKLEFELGPETGPPALPKLWELLPGLHNLQHLDLENSKIGDDGAEKLADALVSLCSLEILNLSQNCIGERGVKKLATTLTHLPKLHCLSLYSNVISDEGAESLAAALPHMASLTDLDVTYNKLTNVGAQSLGTSLRHCKQIKSLRMWNQCIPGGVYERLQQQDHRIRWH